MPEMTENLIRLKSVHGVGNATLWNLLREFGDSDGILGATISELRAIRGVTADKAARILDSTRFDPRPEMDKAATAGVDIIPYNDPAYPKPLQHSFDPPVILYVRGRLVEADQVAVGIVGTRRASPYGRERALALAADLARGGFTIVSGLARGIDTFAHIGAMNASGRTVGVLGCGFDHMYPKENLDLALEMTRNGAVVSEFSMATPPSRDTFPTRNRIIAGMSLGLVVVEAPLRSGSLITARLANEIGRSVFALPGRVGDAASEGCNKLIQDGAVMLTSVDDVFHELNPQLPPPPPPKRDRDTPAPIGKNKGLFAPPPVTAPPANPKLSTDQESLMRFMDGEWRNIDDLIEQSGLPPGKVAACLGMLKMMRLIDQGPGQNYRRHERAAGKVDI